MKFTTLQQFTVDVKKTEQYTQFKKEKEM